MSTTCSPRGTGWTRPTARRVCGASVVSGWCYGKARCVAMGTCPSAWVSSPLQQPAAMEQPPTFSARAPRRCSCGRLTRTTPRRANRNCASSWLDRFLQQRLPHKWQEALDTALARGALGVEDAEPPRLKSIEIPNATAQEMFARLAPDWPMVANFEDSKLKRLGVMTHNGRIWRSPQCWDSRLAGGVLHARPTDAQIKVSVRIVSIQGCREPGASVLDARMDTTRGREAPRTPDHPNAPSRAC